MIMKKYLSFFAAALLLAACQSDDIAEQKAQAYLDGSIQFGVASTEDVTRTTGKTIGVIGDDKATDEVPLSHYGFGVFACYTGANVYENVTVKPDFMYNQKVSADVTDPENVKWIYNPVKYWPNTGNTTFFAYAPYVDHTKIDFEKPEKSHCIAGFSDPNDEGDPWLIYVLAPDPWDLNTGQCDLLFGTNSDPDIDKNPNMLWDNQTKADITSSMNFTFRHALGIVGDQIKIKIDQDVLDHLHDANAKLYIDHIDMKYKNLTRKAKLILNSKLGTPNWKPIVSGEVTTERSVTISKKEIDALNVNSKVGKYSVLDGYVDVDNEHYLNVDGIEETDPIVLKTGKGLFFIPYQVAEDPQQLEVTLYYQILAENMEPYNGVAKSITKFGTSKKKGIQEKPGLSQDVIININKDPKWDKIYAPKVGDFYYSDGTWGDLNTHETGARPIGVIGYLGNDIGTYDSTTGEKGTAKHGLVIAFTNTKHTFTAYVPDLPENPGSSKYNKWGIAWVDTPLPNYTSFADAYNEVNGEYNTNVLFNLWTVTDANQTNSYWAAWECSEYATQGVGAKGKWHIGTFGEWARIFDALGKFLDMGNEGAIAASINSLNDGDIFYPSVNGLFNGSWVERLDQHLLNNYSLFDPKFDSGGFIRNKFKPGLRYWTSTEVSTEKAISFGVHWVEKPNYNDGVMFFKDTDTMKNKEYLIRPLLTF